MGGSNKITDTLIAAAPLSEDLGLLRDLLEGQNGLGSVDPERDCLETRHQQRQQRLAALKMSETHNIPTANTSFRLSTHHEVFRCSHAPCTATRLSMSLLGQRTDRAWEKQKLCVQLDWTDHTLTVKWNFAYCS